LCYIWLYRTWHIFILSDVFQVQGFVLKLWILKYDNSTMLNVWLMCIEYVPKRIILLKVYWVYWWFRRGYGTHVAHWELMTEQGRNKYRGLQSPLSSIDFVIYYCIEYCVGLYGARWIHLMVHSRFIISIKSFESRVFINPPILITWRTSIMSYIGRIISWFYSRCFAKFDFLFSRLKSWKHSFETYVKGFAILSDTIHVVIWTG